MTNARDRCGSSVALEAISDRIYLTRVATSLHCAISCSRKVSSSPEIQTNGFWWMSGMLITSILGKLMHEIQVEITHRHSAPARLLLVSALAQDSLCHVDWGCALRSQQQHARRLQICTCRDDKPSCAFAKMRSKGSCCRGRKIAPGLCWPWKREESSRSEAFALTNYEEADFTPGQYSSDES